MGVYFSIAHSITFTEEPIDCNSSSDQYESEQSNSEINRNIRSKTAMLFKFTEETKHDTNNGNKNEAGTFHPLSFIEFVEKRPVSFSNTPIVVIEGVPQSIQNIPRRSHRQSQQPKEISNKESSSNVLKEVIPDLPQKFSYKNLNRELHQNFEISQYKVNAVRFWILKSNTIREKTMAKAVDCCRHFDFTSFVSSQYVRVENVFSDVKSNDFQSLALALRPQGFSNLSNSPPNSNKLKISTGASESNSNRKSDGLGGLMDFSKTAPISIPKYHNKEKMFNIQIDTNTSSNNINPPKTQENLKTQQVLKAPIFPLLSTSPTPDRNLNLSENSSGNSSENLSENLSENSPEYLSETSSELLRNTMQTNNMSPTPTNKPTSLTLSPLRLPALTPERNCFSSRRPCEINCNNDYSNVNGLEVPQFSGDEDFFNYSCYSEDDRIKFRYRNSNECDMVIPGLFIGGEKAAHDKKLLRNLKITHIVNLNVNDSGGENLDENGKEIDDDEGMDDDTTTNESNSPFKLEIPSQTPTQSKSKKPIFSPRPNYSHQSQQSKMIWNDNDNDDSNKQKDSNESESENQTSNSGSFKIGKISRFNVRLSDSVFQDLNDDFWGALRFVEQAIHSGGNVLAHCRRGISRSAALCVAYLMDDRGMTFDDAIALLKRQRPSVNINQGFEDQLRTFSRTVEAKRKAGIVKENDN